MRRTLRPPRPRRAPGRAQRLAGWRVISHSCCASYPPSGCCISKRLYPVKERRRTAATIIRRRVPSGRAPCSRRAAGRGGEASASTRAEAFRGTAGNLTRISCKAIKPDSQRFPLRETRQRHTHTLPDTHTHARDMRRIGPVSSGGSVFAARSEY